jgi:hypothetical protein
VFAIKWEVCLAGGLGRREALTVSGQSAANKFVG